MSKSIDLTKLGGYPLCQDDIDYLQTAYNEALIALAQTGGDGPMVISGLVITKTPMGGTIYDYSFTDGWVLYNGEMIRMPAGGIAGVDESVNAVYVALTRTSNPLNYNDGSSPDVVNDVTAALVSQVIGTADDASHFLLSDLKPYGREANATQIIINTASGFGTVGGVISYRKNFLNNTLQIIGAMISTTPEDFPASPNVGDGIILATLPAGYRPANKAIFSIAQDGALYTDATGALYNVLSASINPSGQFVIAWRQGVVGNPVGAIFNCIIPLD